MEDRQVVIVNPLGRKELVELAAFAAGAYAGWTLAEGQHWAVKAIAALIGGAGASRVIDALI